METKILKNVVLSGGAAIVASSVMGTDAQAQGFDGVYAGLSFGANFGDPFQYTDEYSFEGESFGGFVGVNIPLNQEWVLSGELAYNSGADLAADFYDNAGVSDVIDVRARLGRVYGDTMVYGAFGISSGTYDSGFSYNDGATVSGTNIGMGVEWNFNETMFVGGDYTKRYLDGSGIDGELDTATVRFGMRF